MFCRDGLYQAFFFQRTSIEQLYNVAGAGYQALQSQVEAAELFFGINADQALEGVGDSNVVEIRYGAGQQGQPVTFSGFPLVRNDEVARQGRIGPDGKITDAYAIRFKYPFAEDTILTEGIRLANIMDIACMKIDAIMGRGKKKDFCDLYYLLQYFSLTEIMEAYSKMYAHSTLFHVYKSLTWFEDADLDGDLVVLDKKFSWDIAKKAIVKAVEKSI